VVALESDDNLRLEIGHVPFIDIVGYSKLLNEEQKERLNQLIVIVLATATVEATDEQLVRATDRRRNGARLRRKRAEEPARARLRLPKRFRIIPNFRSGWAFTADR